MSDGRRQRPLLRADQLVTRQDGIGFDVTLTAGDRIGILGAAGSGKTALLRVLASLRSPVSGRLYWNGVNGTHKLRWLLGKQRAFVALLFTNPYTSLEPWAPVRHFLGKLRRAPEVRAALLRQGHIPVIASDGDVRSLSGVDRIRLALVVALRHNPRIVLVDDVFRMVVPEIWGQLFEEFDAQLGETRGLIVASRYWQALSATRYLFVLHKGNVVEWGPRASVFSQPLHPYTRWLLDRRTHARVNWPEPAGGAAGEGLPEPVAVTAEHWVRWR